MAVSQILSSQQVVQSENLLIIIIFCRNFKFSLTIRRPHVEKPDCQPPPFTICVLDYMSMRLNPRLNPRLSAWLRPRLNTRLDFGPNTRLDFGPAWLRYLCGQTCDMKPPNKTMHVGRYTLLVPWSPANLWVSPWLLALEPVNWYSLSFVPF